MSASERTAGLWREWSKGASPDLLERFDARSLGVLRGVRRRFPSLCGPQHPSYLEMRRASVHALDNLAEMIEAEEQCYSHSEDDHAEY